MRGRSLADVDTLAWIVDTLVIDFVGGLTQLRFLHDGLDAGASCRSDFRLANELIDAVCTCEDQKTFLRKEAMRRASAIVEKNWPIVEMLALRLYGAGKLIRDQIVDVIRSVPGGYRFLREEEPMPSPYWFQRQPRDNKRPADVSELRYRDWVMQVAPVRDKEMRHRPGTLSMPRPAMSAERRQEVLKAVAVRELADEGMEATTSNVTWWIKEILENGQEANEAR
ncbi:MAG TPA: hypothetical protein VF913_18525 [Xanthobacteraceae bacterium]